MQVRRVLLPAVATVLLAACVPQASLLPHGEFGSPTSSKTTALDVHDAHASTSIDLWFPSEVITNPDLEKFTEILRHVGDVERENALKTDIKDAAFSLAFRFTSATIRMASVEGRIEFFDPKKGSTFRFRNFVFDRRQNRLVSLSEMFEDRWPAAREAINEYLVAEIIKQRDERFLPSRTAEDLNGDILGSISMNPQWVLLPGEPNRTSSGIRFDFAPEKIPASLDEVFQIEVPVSVFWEFLIPDWKQRFVRP